MCVYLCVSWKKWQKTFWGEEDKPLCHALLCVHPEGAISRRGRAVTPVSCCCSSGAPEQPWPLDSAGVQNSAKCSGSAPWDGFQREEDKPEATWVMLTKRMAPALPVWIAKCSDAAAFARLIWLFPASSAFWAFCETPFYFHLFPKATISVWKNF